MEREEFPDALLRERLEGVEGGFGEWLMLGRALQLHETAVVRHHDVQVDLGRRVVGVVEVQGRHAVAHAHRDGGDLAADRVLGERAVGHQLRDGVVQGDHAARDGGAARPAVRLDDVAVDDDLAFTELLEVHGRAQGAPDEALDLGGAGVQLQLLDVAVLASAPRRRGQHRVFGGDPSPARVAQERRHLLLHARGAEDPRVAPLDQHAAGGVLREVPNDLDSSQFVRFSHVPQYSTGAAPRGDGACAACGTASD